MRLINGLVFGSWLLSHLLLAGCRSCNEAENYPNDALVLIDSLPRDDTLNAYMYAFNSGVIGGYGSSFFRYRNLQNQYLILPRVFEPTGILL